MLNTIPADDKSSNEFLPLKIAKNNMAAKIIIFCNFSKDVRNLISYFTSFDQVFYNILFCNGGNVYLDFLLGAATILGHCVAVCMVNGELVTSRKIILPLCSSCHWF